MSMLTRVRNQAGPRNAGMPSDTKTRGHLALIAAYATVGIPTLAVGGVLSGTIHVQDVEPLLNAVWLIVGPIAGLVFGYYFSATRQ